MKFISVEEAAQRLHLSQSQVRRRMAEGKHVTGVKKGGRWYVLEDDTFRRYEISRNALDGRPRPAAGATPNAGVDYDLRDAVVPPVLTGRERSLLHELQLMEEQQDLLQLQLAQQAREIARLRRTLRLLLQEDVAPDQEHEGESA